MIHTLLNLTRPLIIYDTETTGLDTKKDRIVEIGFQIWEPEGPCKNCENQLNAFKNGFIKAILPCEYCKDTGHVDGGLVKEYRTLVNPGVSIPAKATEVHGITESDMVCCSRCEMPRAAHPYYAGPNPIIECPDFRPVPTFKQLAPNLAKGFSGCDFAGKNVRFDLRITAAEMARAGVEWRYDGARIIDGDRLESLLNPRSLSHLYRKYAGKDLEGAHGALTDVIGSRVVIEGQMESAILFTGEKLPRDLDELHKLQWPGWIDSEGSFVFVDGVPCFGRWGKYAGQPMEKADVGYWDWILKSDFSLEIKTLAGQAKLGKFPEAK